MSVSKHRLVSHDPAESEISELYIALTIYEHIAWFEISVKDFAFLPTVALKQSKVHLCQYFPCHFFRNVLLRFLASFDQSSHVSLLTILHNDIDAARLLVDDAIVVADDVWMPEITQNIDFRYKLLFFFFTHSTIVELFPNENASICLPSDLAD